MTQSFFDREFLRRVVSNRAVVHSRALTTFRFSGIGSGVGANKKFFRYPTVVRGHRNANAGCDDQRVTRDLNRFRQAVYKVLGNLVELLFAVGVPDND